MIKRKIESLVAFNLEDAVELTNILMKSGANFVYHSEFYSIQNDKCDFAVSKSPNKKSYIHIINEEIPDVKNMKELTDSIDEYDFRYVRVYKTPSNKNTKLFEIHMYNSSFEGVIELDAKNPKEYEKLAPKVIDFLDSISN